MSLRGGKLIFECDTQGENLQVDEQQQPTVPVVVCNTEQKDAFVISNVTTRGQSQKANFNTNLPNHDNLSLVNTPRVKDLGFPAAASEVLANQPAQGQNEPALDSTEEVWDEVGRRTEVSLGQFCVSDPNFVKSKYNSKLEAFYHAFIDVAEYLDMNQLFKACMFDPYLNRVIDILKTRKAYIMDGKTFF